MSPGSYAAASDWSSYYGSLADATVVAKREMGSLRVDYSAGLIDRAVGALELRRQAYEQWAFIFSPARGTDTRGTSRDWQREVDRAWFATDDLVEATLGQLGLTWIAVGGKPESARILPTP